MVTLLSFLIDSVLPQLYDMQTKPLLSASHAFMVPAMFVSYILDEYRLFYNQPSFELF